MKKLLITLGLFISLFSCTPSNNSTTVPVDSTSITYQPKTVAAPKVDSVRYLNQVFYDWVIDSGEYKPGYNYIVYQPKNDSAKKRPFIIVYHAGGGKIQDVKSWCEDWVKLGYVAMSGEYKLSTGDFNTTEQKNAVIKTWEFEDYLKVNSDKYRLKTKKCFEMGVSAGALTALQSGIGLNERSNPYFNNAFSPDIKIYIAATATLSGAANPDFMNFINAGDPPNFFYHGALDKTIPYSQALATYNKMISVGIPSKFMGFPDKGHKLESHDIIYKDLKQNFYNVLNPKKGS